METLGLSFFISQKFPAGKILKTFLEVKNID